MNKQTIVILLLFIIIILGIWFAVMQNMQNERELERYNSEFDKYLTSNQLYGTDVATLINKAIDNNNKNGVEKNEKGYYIDNDMNSIKIYIKLEDEGEYYQMERIFKVGMIEFVKNFNLEGFKCTEVNYHKKTGKIKDIYFEVI